MDLAAFPWAQGSLVVLALSVIVSVFTMVYKGLLVPRSHVDDLRADRDARLAEAEKDAERGWKLYEKEQASHEMTRRALVDQALGVALPSIAVAETAEKILTELQAPGSGDE